MGTLEKVLRMQMLSRVGKVKLVIQVVLRSWECSYLMVPICCTKWVSCSMMGEGERDRAWEEVRDWNSYGKEWVKGLQITHEQPNSPLHQPFWPKPFPQGTAHLSYFFKILERIDHTLSSCFPFSPFFFFFFTESSLTSLSNNVISLQFLQYVIIAIFETVTLSFKTLLHFYSQDHAFLFLLFL